MFEEETRRIRVRVRPIYMAEDSEPDEFHYVWAYLVRIENESDQSVQLLDRYWRITDALGRVHEVRGEGVVGEQPVIEPGEAYEYSSGAPLETTSGFMQGSYGMVTDKGERWDIQIPLFPLEIPDGQTSVH